MPRMNILNDSSKESFSKPPLFSGDQRKYFMQGSAELFKRCNRLRSAIAWELVETRTYPITFCFMENASLYFKN
tara:strand:- start:2381 stop:2602 length:222 start_codon:yes stop_codon:yes gene_type:complete